MSDCGPTEADWNWFKRQNCKKRGDEWVRNAHMDIFQADGSNIISQNIGLCVDGDHGSMTHYPYSLKVLAGKEYDKEHPSFQCDLFSYYNKSGTSFSHIQDFNNLVFRNGGNEYNKGASDAEQKGSMLRWNIGSRLADEAGFMVADARMGGYEDLYYSFPDISTSPLLLPENQKKLEETVSVADMFSYYAFEVLVNNTDFPKKNYAIWRYNAADSAEESSPFSDGKFRFFINDLDCTYDFRYDDDLWTAYFDHIKGEGVLMGSAVQVEKYKIQFLNTLCDLMNSRLFDAEHLNTVIDDANFQFSLIARYAYAAEDEAKRQHTGGACDRSRFSHPEKYLSFT